MTTSPERMPPGRGTPARGSPRIVRPDACPRPRSRVRDRRTARESGRLPFTIVAVANRDGLIRGGRGPREGDRIGATAVCLLASITKPIVATAVMRLAQEGRFPLSVPIRRWLPELDTAGMAPFTAWHVLTHTTGFPDIDLVSMLSQGGGQEELLRLTIAAGQATPPGNVFRYASFTFDLLVVAIERALDTPFDTILRETVLDPLGMAETGFDLPPAGPGRGPVVYGDLPGSMPRVPGVSNEHAVAAFSAVRLAGGGLWSTAHDLVRFGRAFLRGGELDGVRILGRPLVDLMTREVTVNGLGAAVDRLVRRALRDRLGQARPDERRVAVRLRARRRHRHAPVGRPRARPRLRAPERHLGRRRPADRRRAARGVRRHRVTMPPPPHVVAAFGGAGAPSPLAGGRGSSGAAETSS